LALEHAEDGDESSDAITSRRIDNHQGRPDVLLKEVKRARVGRVKELAAKANKTHKHCDSKGARSKSKQENKNGDKI